MTKEIPVHDGLVAFVDDEDFQLVSNYTWHAEYRNRAVYAKAYIKGSHPRKNVYMHRLLLTAPSGMEVDHKDRNGLNNRRHNLRLATKSQNRCNVDKYRVGRTELGAPPTSTFKGVSWSRKYKRWIAQISVNSKTIPLGPFPLETDAALAYNKAAKMYFGAFARLNVIKGNCNA